MSTNLEKQDFLDRYDKIKQYLNKTPLIYAPKLSELSGNEVYLKLDNLQKTGSFKIRGALSKMIVTNIKVLKKGVIAASAGNHSQGVSFAAKLLDVPATIVMPTTAPISKINATKSYGVDVMLFGNFFDDAQQKAKDLAKEMNKTLILGSNDPDVILGQGSVAVEILDQLPDAEYIIAPVGTGGMLSGVAAYAKQVNPKIKVIGVETENAPSFYEAKKLGKPVLVDAKFSIADGIAVKKIGDLTFEVLEKYADGVLLVSEEEIAKTILFLFENCKVVSEGAGAVSAAAILFDKLDIKNKKVVCVLSGGNIDVTSFLNITNHALYDQKRRVTIWLDSMVGKNHLAEIANLCDHNGIVIYKIGESQYENNLEINHEVIRLVVDVNNEIELNHLLSEIKDRGYRVLSE